MQYEIIISGGTVVDGTGAEGVMADVAIDNGRITKLGDLGDATAARTIDATGKLVTPGFVDLHTHYDAQIGWDPGLRSSSWHGVTTILMGNCGMTFAPCKPEDQSQLANMMEWLEDIPAAAILDGLPWDWTDMGGYLDSVQALEPAINVVSLVGHSSIRYSVMGDRCFDKDVPATDAEIEQMVQLVKESVAGGAIGFSSSRYLDHKAPDGRHMPGTWAEHKELHAIQQALVESGGEGTLFQAVFDFDTRREGDKALLENAAQLGCQVLFSNAARDDVDEWRAFHERVQKAGKRMTSLVQCRPSGVLFGLIRIAPFMTPAWDAVMALPTVADRVAALREPARRQVLINEGKAAGLTWGFPASILHPLGQGKMPNYDMGNQADLQTLADAAGVDPVEMIVDRLIESEGRELFNLWLLGGDTECAWDYMRMEHCVPMVSDSGAHVTMIADADSPTFLLSDITRERGVFTVPEVIHRITQKSAEVLGLKERGVLREGWHADINVIDYEKLDSCYPEYVTDFPHGAGRFTIGSKGYVATLVAGKVIAENGELTGERPGSVLRDFNRG